MTPIDHTSAAAMEHVRDLQTEASRARLLRLARCCHPRTWGRAIEPLRRRIVAVRDHVLGPVGTCCPCA